ncbi:hypothetical protein AYO21_07856 [Fonsecaea monophora]|uniref:FCP1 homology domain-containing protein n=1 Tax=Fonsecaea monophora TaxID=254056 RepID=A0A177F0P1_9EURO|nr:hypothetical protein AYO21_07856 [Fonsecaea monophora]OAG37884.1 hypothetical protein AYO21_07856 [Fonsecaea monophora]
MGRTRGDRYQPNDNRLPAAPVAMPQEFQPRNVGAYDSYRPDRNAQIRQGDYFQCYLQYRIDTYNAADSWRPYRNDESNSQTATNFQSSYHDYFGRAQHETHPAASAGLNTGAFAAQTPQELPSYYRPYQPLRVSNGTRERYIVQHAQNIFGVPRPQTSSRYQFRERRPAQIAPYSTPAARAPASSAETAGRRGQAGSTPISRAQQRRLWIPDVKPPPAPTATEEYKRQAALPPVLRETPQKLLVILDLNGTLLVRPQHHRPKHIIVRPGVPKLLDYLFQNHVVMVYSSAKPENCAAMVSQFFHPTQRGAMAGVWARDKLGLSREQYDTKVQVYKKLEPIWEDKKIRKKAGTGRKWDQSNTVLVDDSQLKGLAQPHNLLQIPEFLNNAPREGGPALFNWQREQEQIVYSIQQKLEELKWQVDVSRMIREWQTGKRQAPGVVDETVDQKALQGAPDRGLSPTPSVGSPEPSGGEGDSSVSQRLHTAEPTLLSDAEVLSGLDRLEKEISRSLNLNQNPNQGTDPATGPAIASTSASNPGVKIRDDRRSESPIDESVWADILRGRGEASNVGESIQETPGQKASPEEGKGKGKGKGQRQRHRKKKGPKEAIGSESLGNTPPTPESIDA